MTALTPGTCRHCGCHGEACTLPNGDRCGWRDYSHTCCTGPACERAELKRVRSELARVRAAKPRKKYPAWWGYGAIRLDKERERRRAKRRKGRAA